MLKWVETMLERFDLLNRLSNEMLNLIEELDDEVRTQGEYYEKRLLEELSEDLENQILLHDIRIYSLTKPEIKGRCGSEPEGIPTEY